MNKAIPSLIELLAIRLSPQAGKSLVIPRRRESSKTKIPHSGMQPGFDSLREIRSTNRIPACAGMTTQRCQRGFSLVSAIFLLVVIAALGTFAVTLSTTQQQSAALDVMGARAYQAARAGIEWGAYQVLPNSAVVGGFAATCRTTGIIASTVPLTNTLSGFNVNVGCRATSHVEDTITLWVYQLTSSAVQGTAATPDYVERVMTDTIAQ